MWKFFEERFNAPLKFDPKTSFYCGDEAGRKGPPADFSDIDQKFA
jgi:hypothetical protein